MGNVRSGVRPAASVRRFAGLGLAAVLAAALAGCDGGSDSPTTPAPIPAPVPAPAPAPPPSKDDPAAFTQAFVQRAVDLFEAEGLEATLAAYNDPASVDESWYVFVMDAEGVIIAHATVPENVGASVLGPLGVDSAGHVFGPALAAAPEDGVWVDYNYFNPATGDEGIKHTWAVRRDGIVFASGWYEGAPTDSSIEAQTQGVVRQAVGWVRERRLEAALDFYATRASTSGPWYVVFLDAAGVAVSHGGSPALVGKSIFGPLGLDVTGKAFGAEMLSLPPEGGWVDYAYLNPATGEQGTKHSWAQFEAGHWIVSGWYESGAVEDDPAARAVGFVGLATRYADAHGEDAAVAFYNTDASWLGSWYVFIIDADGILVAIAPAPDKLGLDAYDPEDGTDIKGHFYAPKLAEATEEGVWVTYWQPNPAAGGEQQLKHTFARRHGNLVFASGYYVE